MGQQVSIHSILGDLKYYLEKHPDFKECKDRENWRGFRKRLKLYFRPPDGRKAGLTASYSVFKKGGKSKRVRIKCIFKEFERYLKGHPDFIKDRNPGDWQGFRQDLISYFASPGGGDCCPGWIPSYCIE